MQDQERARNTLCDISEAKDRIGYEPKVNLEDYISEALKSIVYLH